MSEEDKQDEKKSVEARQKKNKKDEVYNNKIEVNPKLEEAVGGTVVLGWGRMNPITIGHEKLINKIKDVARKENAEAIVYLTHSQNSKKDPLSYSDKIRLAQKAFGKVVQKSNAKTIIQVMQELQEKYKNVILVVGSDRVSEFNSLLNKYNGKDYTFDSINIVSAGERDADADGVEGMSASKMREAVVRADNPTAKWVDSKGKKQPSFKSGLPKKIQRDAQSIWDMVRAGLKLVEELEEQGLLVVEVLNRQQRRQRGITMRRYKTKIANARKRSMRKAADSTKLEKRARKAAINVVRKKVAQKRGENYSSLDPAQKMLIDKKVAKRKNVIDRIAKKMLPQVRRKERERLSSMRNKKTNESFEMFVEAIDNPPTKRFHEVRGKDGRVKLDQRFRAFKGTKVQVENADRLRDTHQAEREALAREHEREMKRAKTRELRKDIRDIRKEETEQVLEWIEEVANDIFESVELETSKIEKSLTEKALKHNVAFDDVKAVYEDAINSGQTIEEAFSSVNISLTKVNEATSPAQQAAIAIAKKKKKEAIEKNEDGNYSYVKEEFFTLDEQFEMEMLDEAAIMDKALEAIHKHVQMGKDLGDIAFQVSRAAGVNTSSQELKRAYVSKYGEPKKSVRVNPAVVKRLKTRFGFKEEHGAGDRGTEKVTKRYKKDTPGENINEAFEKLFEEVTQKQIQDLEKFADRLLDKFGVDVEFTRHFADRMNDDRNNPAISIAELQKFFKKIAKNKAKDIKANGDSEAVLNDIQADLNLPVVIKYDRNKEEFEVVNKTIMRKKNFKTPNKVIKY